jgi:hypothetical protein
MSNPTPRKPRPKPEDYGYESQDGSGEHGEGGWCIEGGEEAYDAGVSQWEAENINEPTP